MQTEEQLWEGIRFHVSFFPQKHSEHYEKDKNVLISYPVCVCVYVW